MDELNRKTELCNNSNRDNMEVAGTVDHHLNHHHQQTTNSLKEKSQMSASSSMEKCDTTPENSGKCDELPEFVGVVMGAEGQNVTMATTNNDSLNNKEEFVQYNNKNVNRSISLQQMQIPVDRLYKEAEVVENKEESSPDESVRNALAFTINFGPGKVDQTRHEKMLERFQNRHKRGVSLSKLESSPSPSPVNMSSSVRAKTPQSIHLPRKPKLQMDTSECSLSSELEDKSGQVRLRDKRSVTRDTSSKRHSWSPRTSMAEKTQNSSSGRFTPKSTTLMMAMESQKQNCSPTDQYSSDFNSESLNSSINLPCIEPPLENFPKTGNDGDSVSEAGTYTLDGDNYTEEQKERMNIDKLFKLPVVGSHLPIVTAPQRPKNFHDELEVIDLEKHDQPLLSASSTANKVNERRKNNILEVSYYHEPESVGSKSKQSYLEKLKSRVKDMGRKSKSPDKSGIQPSNDQGMFTSVTTSGVLSSKPSLSTQNHHPKIGRKNSLTQSHIDSSEYVQGVSKLNIHKNDHDDEKILNVYNEEGSALKNAPTKKDWIQEWAKNAREYSKNTKNAQTKISTMTRSYDFGSTMNYDYDIDMTKSDYYDSKKYDEFGDNLDKQHLHRKHMERFRNNNNEYSSDPSFDYFNRSRTRYRNFEYDAGKTLAKPPMSPSKIPSPINSIGRARSVSRNRSLQGSNSDLSANDTEMYLHKTAVAISTLQNLHRRNSMRSSSCHSSPLSPSPRRISPKISPMNSMQSPVHHQILYSPQHQQLRNMKNLINHKRNLSLDSAAESYPTQLSNYMADFTVAKMNHTRHNSFEGMSNSGHSHMPPKPIKCFQHFDQTPIPYPGNYVGYDDDNIGVGLDDDDNLIVITATKKKPSMQVKQIKQTPPPSSSPIKRSSSFSVKQLQPSQLSLTPKMAAKNNLKIQKSASSNSFNKMMTNYANNNDKDYYMNDDDNLEPEPDYSTDSDFSENENDAQVMTAEEEKEPITNTRYNKTFLMRMEQNKKIAAGVKQGLAACPNTPEMPRRQMPARARASMPRDSSLNRMKQDLQVSRKPMQKESPLVGQSVAAAQVANKTKVQPKYMDISKYKPQTTPTFLKKDESKSYLLNKEVIRKSPSSASVALSRTEPGRASTRSVKSAGAKAAAKKDAQAKAKEQELEMWRRRSSYNPMQAALDGKKKQEEARRQAQQQQDRLSKSNESTVLRSQSYHSGVVGLAGAGRLYQGTVSNCSNVNLRSVYNQSPNSQNRWTLTSTESSEDLDDDYTIH